MDGKVMYVEDEAFFAGIIKSKLEEKDLEVDVFADGESALAAAKKGGYRLILLDLILPKLDGLEVLRLLKEDSVTKDVPVIILSNQSEEDNRKKAMELGAKAYYVKVNAMPNEIVSMVSNLLGEG